MLIRINEEIVINPDRIETAERSVQAINSRNSPTWQIWFVGHEDSDPNLILSGKDAEAFDAFLKAQSKNYAPARPAWIDPDCKAAPSLQAQGA